MKFLRLLSAVFATSLFAAPAFAGDPAGTWKWSIAGPDGSEFETTLKLELKDGSLTGLYSNQFGDSQIRKAEFKDGAIAFEVEREFDGNKFVVKFQGRLDGDTIKGTIDFPGFGGGEPRKADWNAKRVKPEAKK